MLLIPSIILWLLVGIANTQFPDGEELDKPVSFSGTRERTRLHAGWRFWRSDSIPDGVVYERRPDANSDELVELKPWIMPTANEFIVDPANQHQSPDSQPAVSISFASPMFDDSNWENVTVPHDWAIKLPFLTGSNPIIPAAMGQLPVHGVGWHRRDLVIGDNINDTIRYLDIDGGMSYPMVWVNGHLVGGWPFGYNSFRLNVSPYLKEGSNTLAIRTENPAGHSSRWYPGAGLYRNIWLTTVTSMHVGHWGTKVSRLGAGELVGH